MASGLKAVLLSQSGNSGYITIVADTSSALTYDLIRLEFVLIEADAVASTKFSKGYVFG